MPWDIILALLVGAFALVTFGAAIQRRRRDANLLSVSFFLLVSALAVGITIYWVQDYWRRPPAPRPGPAEAIITTDGTPPPMPSGPQGANAAQLVYGRSIAERDCANCHQIAPGLAASTPVMNATTGASVTAPSFAAIARDEKTSDASLRAFLQLPHYPMPDRSLAVARSDMPYLTAYILSLRSPGASGR